MDGHMPQTSMEQKKLTVADTWCSQTEGTLASLPGSTLSILRHELKECLLWLALLLLLLLLLLLMLTMTSGQVLGQIVWRRQRHWKWALLRLSRLALPRRTGVADYEGARGASWSNTVWHLHLLLLHICLRCLHHVAHARLHFRRALRHCHHLGSVRKGPSRHLRHCLATLGGHHLHVSGRCCWGHVGTAVETVVGAAHGRSIF